MEAIVRTIYAAALQTSQLLGLPFVLVEKTTLNEALNINGTATPGNADMPHMRYMCIGNGGHRMKVGGNGIAVPEPIQHRSSDANLYNILPFVLRTVDNDLTAGQRQGYSLRKQVTIANTNYIAYYLKRIDMTGVVPTMNYNTVVDGVTTTTAFIPNTTNLNPQPPALNNQGNNVVTGDYLTASALLQIPFTADDVTELLNVANILYGSPDYAIISEIGLVSGVDRMLSVPSGAGGSFNFLEVVFAQVCTFISSFHSMQFTTNGLNLAFDVGATEALLTV